MKRIAYLKGTYIGKKWPLLKNKTALVRWRHYRPTLLAQFDDASCHLGYGWTEFYASEFKIEPVYSDEDQES